MLVRGHRVPYDPQELADENLPLSDMSLHTNYLLWVIVGILITAAFCFLLYKREKKAEQTPEIEEGEKEQ